MRTAYKLLGGTAAAGAVFCGELYRYVFCRHQPAVLRLVLDSKGHEPEYYQYRDSAKAALMSDPHDELSIFSARGQRLVGYYFRSGSTPSGKIAFIIHGYRSDACEAAGTFWEYYKSRGFDLFCCENVAHGPSSGELIGYGVYESADCLKWLEYLRSRFGDDIQVVLHGFSMGGATVASLSDRAPACVRFIVDDCGYTSAADILRPKLGVLYAPIAAVNRAAAGYGLEETDVRAHVANAKTPMLFVHGRQDRTVPFNMGQELYELCPGEKASLFVEDARHVECMYRAGREYADKLDNFIEKYIR